MVNAESSQAVANKWIAKIRQQFGFNRETPTQAVARTRARLSAYEKRSKLAQSFLRELNDKTAMEQAHDSIS